MKNKILKTASFLLLCSAVFFAYYNAKAAYQKPTDPCEVFKIQSKEYTKALSDYEKDNNSIAKCKRVVKLLKDMVKTAESCPKLKPLAAQYKTLLAVWPCLSKQ